MFYEVKSPRGQYFVLNARVKPTLPPNSSLKFCFLVLKHGFSGLSTKEQMDSVEDGRSDSTDGLSAQPPESGQASYPQAGLATYTQASAVPNGHGAEQVSIRQVIENRPEVQNETHVGLADDRGHLSISNVPGGVQVAVVPSTDDVGVVDGSLASAATAVERADDGTHTVVTAMPADYGLPGPLPPQYVIQHDDHEGKEIILLFVFAFCLGNHWVICWLT